MAQPSVTDFAPSLKHPVIYSDWCTAVQEAKSLFFDKKYRQCAARCAELLEQRKSTAHPIHTAVLSFYAASALDTAAQALFLSWSTKISLLKSARSYYVAATLFLPAEPPLASPSPPSSEFPRVAIGDDSKPPCSSQASPAAAQYPPSDDEEEEDMSDARAFAASKARIAAKRKEKERAAQFPPSTLLSPDSTAPSDPSTIKANSRKHAQLRLQAHVADMAQKIESNLQMVEKMIAKAEEEKRKQPYNGAALEEEDDPRVERREWVMRRAWRSEEREKLGSGGL
ncbi:hypothetical protein GP486_003585 [Trichoglossum hirsutum]|uniref:Uncharacterized protein n=1 Tax=Trichoglossum hirsutum TaxID=265104 RepID=A0A9P8LCS6_9PEZI|nr:hypothetical protein GP486_003585 [Trichoglossum hirsutum]